MSAPSWTLAYHKEGKGRHKQNAPSEFQGFPKPAMGLYPPALLHFPQMGHSSLGGLFLCSHWFFLVRQPTPHSLGMLAAQPGSSAGVPATCHLAVPESSRLLELCYPVLLHFSQQPCSPWSEGSCSLPKEVEMTLQVMVSSWSKMLPGGLSRTWSSHANHPHPGLQEGLCSAQSPGRLAAAQGRRHVVQLRCV